MKAPDDTLFDVCFECDYKTVNKINVNKQWGWKCKISFLILYRELTEILIHLKIWSANAGHKFSFFLWHRIFFKFESKLKVKGPVRFLARLGLFFLLGKMYVKNEKITRTFFSDSTFRQ